MQQTFRESLTEDCPPNDADEINEPRVVFRLVSHNPPTEDDFRSQRVEHPNRAFRNVSECVARGLSVHSDFRASENLLKLPHMRRRGMMVCQVVLDAGAGYIQQTGRDRHHHTWWPFASYDILNHCSVGEAQ